MVLHADAAERRAGAEIEHLVARLRLLVHETNGSAQRAYERLGFVVTGHREPYPLDPATDEVELARPV